MVVLAACTLYRTVVNNSSDVIKRIMILPRLDRNPCISLASIYITAYSESHIVTRLSCSLSIAGTRFGQTA